MRHFLVTLLIVVFASPAMAFFSLMDTGNLVKEGDYRVMGEGQILFDAPSGFNLNGRFSTGFNDDSEFQFEAGLGSVDYYLGAFYKWMPFPDAEGQPALGVRGGLTFADFNGFSTYGFNVTPLISKNFEASPGIFTPYGGLQMGLQNNVNDTFFSMQLVVGLSWKPNEWEFNQVKDFDFMIEYGIEIDDAFDYFSLGAAYNF